MKPKPPTVDGPITKALLDSVELRRKMLDAGHPVAEVDYHVGQGLKALLGNKRELPWRFLCERCHDTGWSPVRPSPEEEARLVAMYGTAEESHGYSVKCEPCPWNNREREKRRQKAGHDGPEDDDFTAAALVKKPTGGFKKFGR